MITKTQTLRALASIAGLAPLLIVGGCAPETARVNPSPAAIPAPLCPPLRVVELLDQTGSADTNGVPAIEAASLHPLLDVIERCSGELAFGLIRDRSNVPLLRIALVEPAPEHPIAESIPDNALEAVEVEDRNRAAEEQWAATVQRRHTQWATQVGEFESRMQPLLDRRDKAGTTDIAGALDRIGLYLGEDPARWGSTPDLWAILLTDGIHTLRGKVRNTLPSPTHLALVNSTGAIGNLESFRPLRFDAVNAAIGHVVATHALAYTAQAKTTQ